jgi:hypothetical protein
MIWLTWRLHRNTWLVVALAVLAAIISSGYGHAMTQVPLDPSVASGGFEYSLSFSQIAAVLAPAIMGLFLGVSVFAPEIEHNTHTLTLTQSVSRTRWFTLKTAGPLLVAGLAGGLLAAAFEWAWSPYISWAGLTKFEPLYFDAIGVIPAAYAILATATGAVAGLWTRRVLPAVAITLGVYVAVRLSLGFARSSMLPADHLTSPYAQPPEVPEGAFLIDHGYKLVDGTRITGATMQNMLNLCSLPAPLGPQQTADVDACIGAQGVAQHDVLYYGADQFWALQGIEAGITVGLGAVLLAAGMWWARKKLV